MGDNEISSCVTIAQCLNEAAASLNNLSDSALLDAQVLLSNVVGKGRTYFYTWPDKLLTQMEYECFNQLLSRRKLGEPIAYIIGKQEFWSHCFDVDPSTLIPRSDTELLVECALEYVSVQANRLLDLGTGTGAVVLSLALEHDFIEAHGVDSSARAVALALHNKSQLKVPNAQIYESNWFSAVSSTFHVIVSNPPYICVDDHHLTQGDVRFEPKSALVSDRNGLGDIQTIVSQSVNYLEPEGYLLIEHGWTQAQAVKALFQLYAFRNIKTYRDLSGNERVTVGQI